MQMHNKGGGEMLYLILIQKGITFSIDKLNVDISFNLKKLID